ncbi:DUF2946 domain-containing protein [Pelagibius sp. CAU 1746]|uniref:DUF2946 domain-containing protein n=1 Tax=Pelagibius sp. CAU 1746 TaxID=3140370 RepID=UPI00325B466C
MAALWRNRGTRSFAWRDLRSAIMRRPGKAIRFLRPAASLLALALAVVGLLGHGLAMLLVGQLAQAPQASVAAQQTFAASVEICTTEGLRKLARADGPGRGDDPPAGPGHGKVDACPVCTAFAQNGPADLPAAAAPERRTLRPAVPRPPLQAAAATPEWLPAQSRGPPAAA